jgi:hypothetical protein
MGELADEQTMGGAPGAERRPGAARRARLGHGTPAAAAGAVTVVTWALPLSGGVRP